ncbi:butyrophilin subfamily 1 member A1-like [Ochotona curzoniae]|uniref:butyrophilin subfamily 1 member A1-like n=1 Tax=Ochotona curzoniae TaxID=130825 RepID=UPI001B34FF91|nr:butyrophilin subfamily 1 member A1-like [Ochotona curzoniae]
MECGSRPSLLFSFPSLLLLVQLPTWGSADVFQVIGPTDPIVAVLGGDAILPCSLWPPMNAEDMELRWFRSKFLEAVLVYQNGQELDEEQLPQYAGRTLLVRGHLSQGKAAVHIQNIQVSDNGKYTCLFKQGILSDEAILELQVAGLGSAPQVHIEGPEKDGVRVVCKASGWFPKPQVQWRDVRGEKFLEFSEANTQDAAGLFSVESALVVRDNSAGDVTCSILNPILGQEKVMAIPIPGVVVLESELCRRKAAFRAGWRKAQLYADWRKEEFQAWSVTLDPASADADLAISPESTTVTWNDKNLGFWDHSSVLGLEGITSGRCYWEVEIKDDWRSQWALGVCQKHVERSVLIRESSEKGFWVLECAYHEYYACPDKSSPLFLRQYPRSVGIFLDYSEGDVSFYNMTDGSHMFSFPTAVFSGPLHPYFRLNTGDVTLSICSPVGGSEGLPAALSNSPSLEQSGRSRGEGLSSGSGAEVALPGAESPLLSYPS